MVCGKWTWLTQVEASAIVNIVYHKHAMISNCDNTLPCGTTLIQLENTPIRRVSSVSFSEYLLKIKSSAMYCCWVELSVRYDGQSQSEHASLIDEHTRLIVPNRFDLCFEHWICSSGSTGEHTRSVLFRNAARLNLQFDMPDLNTGFALEVQLINTSTRSCPLPDWTFSSITTKWEETC